MRRAALFEGVPLSGRNKTAPLRFNRYFAALSIVTVELGNDAQALVVVACARAPCLDPNPPTALSA